jgi:hypothetical protein
MIRILALLLLCCAPNLAFAAEAVPHLNVEPGCRAAASDAVGALTTVDTCMKDEEDARKELAQKWGSFPAGDRQQCVAEVSGFEPSYVELLECVTMAGEARQMDKDEAAKAAAARTERRKKAKEPTAKN